MAELLSVGLDVGTTTTQLIVSRLTARNRASSLAVPDMEITRRQILHTSPVHFTPLLGPDRVDGDAIAGLVAKEYAAAGIRREDVDTGAVIITGETSRKENAQAVLKALERFAGEFVVATAGPHLESVLAAKGSGAAAYSEATGQTVLHMDIGGGTSNLALIRQGKILATGCLNVGGRLLRLEPSGRLTYVSPVLRELLPWREGMVITRSQAQEAAALLAKGLEMAAGLRPADALLPRLWTHEAGTPWQIPEPCALSFSGGVADCIDTPRDWLAFGDLGPLLGQAIRASRLCAGSYRLGQHTIRATVIGAGCHSTQLCGSTVYTQDVHLPLKDLPVAAVSRQEQDLPPQALTCLITQRLEALQSQGILYLPGWNAPDYSRIRTLADVLARATAGSPCYIALREDMAKALGHALALRLPPNTPCLCLDRLELPPDCYLDVGKPVGPALSVVIKTLILSH